MAAARFTATTFLIAGALLVWALDFAFTYVFVALACARGFADAAALGVPVLPLVIGVATAVALAAVAVMIVRARRRSQLASDQPNATRFASGVALGCAVLAVVAIVFNGFVAALAFLSC